jgi:hypothetical protein
MMHVEQTSLALATAAKINLRIKFTQRMVLLDLYYTNQNRYSINIRESSSLSQARNQRAV